MKKILVATDASEFSKRALTVAVDFARKFNAEIELLYVINSKFLDGTSINSYTYTISSELVDQQGEKVLEDTLKGIDISNITLVKKKLQGKPGEVIVEEVKNENIDLVVMGSHGYGTIVGSLLGSVSQKVIHGANCSVLLVK